MPIKALYQLFLGVLVLCNTAILDVLAYTYRAYLRYYIIYHNSAKGHVSVRNVT